MKLTMDFDLPNDNVEFRHAIRGVRYQQIISEMDDYLRSKIKREDRHDLQPVRDYLTALIAELLNDPLI